MVDSADRQQGRDCEDVTLNPHASPEEIRNGTLARRKVGENHKLSSVAHRVRRLVAQVGDRLFKRVGAIREGVTCRQFHYEEPALSFDRRQFGLVQERRFDLQHAVVGLKVREVRRLLRQQVALPAQMHLQRHHEGLAVGVNRRVRDLREALLEVVVKHVGAVREDGKRFVVAHAENRLLAGSRHCLDDHFNVLDRKAVVELELDELALDGARHVIVVISSEESDGLHGLPEDPVPIHVRLLRRHFALDVLVLDEPTSLQIDRDHLAGPKAPLGHEFFRERLLLVQDAHFGTDHGRAVMQPEVTRGPQAIPVQLGAHVLPVAVSDERRAIPRFLERAPVLVEVPHWVVGFAHAGMVLVRLGHHDHQSLRDLAVAAQ
mmetsp:Transcript_123308/g.348442  ORF Transcript_123308/g.348442 Transcript_123308/m.348442 type:complete len:376 (+) Transcript_123308:152-1279(+)